MAFKCPSPLLSSLRSRSHTFQIAQICHSPTTILGPKCITTFPLLLHFLPPTFTSNSGSKSWLPFSSLFLLPNNQRISNHSNLSLQFCSPLTTNIIWNYWDIFPNIFWTYKQYTTCDKFINLLISPFVTQIVTFPTCCSAH